MLTFVQAFFNCIVGAMPFYYSIGGSVIDFAQQGFRFMCGSLFIIDYSFISGLYPGKAPNYVRQFFL